MPQTVAVQGGVLNGLTLTVWDAAALANAARGTEIENVSFYRDIFRGGPSSAFRGVTFKGCGFGHSVFENTSFINCKFQRVDLTRTQFRNCVFSRCRFVNCDPYNAIFPNTDIDPVSFAGFFRSKGCYKKPSEYNKAIRLFSNLRKTLLRRGDARKSRRAEYYFRVWERKKLWVYYNKKERDSIFPWFWSLLLGAVNGYGERPQYTLFWMFATISLWALGYWHFFPQVVAACHGKFDYWYFSFRLFFAQGFGQQPPPFPLLICQLTEFGFGLILIAILIGSSARKFSA
jgi:hypothetical protein